MSSLLSDAELHGLIDGQIEVHHRADILRRAAASSTDRERISNWQSQCELIRSAFRGVDREVLPTTLDLRAPARLHAVPAVRATIAADDIPPIVAAGNAQRSRWALPLLALCIAAAGLAATWAAGGFSLTMPQPAAHEEARRSVAEIMPAAPSAMAAPASTIPDLSTLGFSLVAAEVQPGPPSSIQFRYRNANAELLTLDVSRASGAAGPVTPAGRALVWHAGTHRYALASDLRPDAMRALVPAVRALALDE